MIHQAISGSTPNYSKTSTVKPGPTNYVPAAAKGFWGLKKRKTNQNISKEFGNFKNS